MIVCTLYSIALEGSEWQELQSHGIFIHLSSFARFDKQWNICLHVNHFCQELRRFIMEHGLEDVLQEEPTSVAEVRMKIPSVSTGGNWLLQKGKTWIHDSS